jgi:hypothetical protein
MFLRVRSLGVNVLKGVAVLLFIVLTGGLLGDSQGSVWGVLELIRRAAVAVGIV